VAEKTMVYGRYNELVNGDYFMVCKPTNITGFPHPDPIHQLEHWTLVLSTICIIDII
jgi:hypothetical protein